MLPTLLDLLSEERDNVSFLTLQALEQMGTNAVPATEAVSKLKNRNLNLRCAAIEALRLIAPSSASPP